MSKPRTKQTRSRSAVTGQFVTNKYAKRHPRTTVIEQVKAPRKNRKK